MSEFVSVRTAIIVLGKFKAISNFISRIGKTRSTTQCLFAFECKNSRIFKGNVKYFIVEYLFLIFYMI
jgi:hypothetical protein